METSAFATLASFQLPMPSRLLASACCPDKDLVVIITRLGNRDRISLWKMQGSKKWEVDVDSNGHANEEIVAMTWSPDCMANVLGR
jgi:anaphase-promoting complex subunit 4